VDYNVPESTTTEGFTPNVRWEPFIRGPRVGYKVTRLDDGSVTYVYMNPSTGGDGGTPDVFVYTGSSNNPAEDVSQFYVVPVFDGPAPQGGDDSLPAGYMRAVGIEV
jgi:hypothetical protein